MKLNLSLKLVLAKINHQIIIKSRLIIKVRRCKKFRKAALQVRVLTVLLANHKLGINMTKDAERFLRILACMICENCYNVKVIRKCI